MEIEKKCLDTFIESSNISLVMLSFFFPEDAKFKVNFYASSFSSR